MAIQLRAQNDLPTLRIVLSGAAARDPTVLFQVARGGATPVEVARCPLRDLGLPPLIEGPESFTRELRIAPAIISQLRTAVASLGFSPIPPIKSLWLELPGPRGYLYLLPWELLLAPLNRTVLRLPNFILRPKVHSEKLQVFVAVLDSTTGVDGAVRRICRAWHQHADRPVDIHVFAGAVVYEKLRHTAGSDRNLVLHNPYQAKPRSEDAWLNWVLDSVQGRAFDVVQVISPGTLTGDRGGVVLPIDPAATSPIRRVIDGSELVTFSSRVGAWALVLTAVSKKSCLPGLLETADTFARARPGVVMVQQLRAGPDHIDIDRGIQLICGSPEKITTSLPGITCWAHPSFVDEQRLDLGLAATGETSLLQASTMQVLAEPDTPAWVAAGSRILENRQSQWLRTGDTNSAAEPAADADAIAALNSVAGLLNRHVTNFLADRDKP